MRRSSLLIVSVLALVCVPSTRAAVPGRTAAQPSTQVEIMDFDFTDANHGWVLGGVVPCPAACPDLVLWKYNRGHRTARALPRDMDWFSVDSGSRVAGVQFANRDDGWLYGLNLYSTHDGGRSWSQVQLPSDFPSWTNFGPIVVRGARVWAFVTACSGGLAHPYCSLYRIGTSAISSDSWDWVLVSSTHVSRLIRLLAMADGRHEWGVPSWLPTGSVNAPCGGRIFPVYLDGTSPANLWAVCANSPGRKLVQRKAVFRSSDAGKSWRKVWDTRGHPGRPRFTRGQVQGLAVTSESTAWIAVWRGPLMVSHDGGVRWQAALSGPSYTGLGPIQFTDSRHGWVELYPGTMLHTANGGRTWQSVVLEPPTS